MYQSIVVPIDGSDNTAVPALEYAAVFDSVEELPNRLREEGEGALKQAAAPVRQNGLQAESVLVETSSDNTGELIVAQAKEWSPDLIVMGTHGRRGLGRFALGSNAEYVLRHTPVPVLLVRKQ